MSKISWFIFKLKKENQVTNEGSVCFYLLEYFW